MNPQQKPAHRPTYRERVLAGQVKSKPRTGLRKVAKTHIQRWNQYRAWIARELPKVPRCGRCNMGKNMVRMEPHHPSGRGPHLFEVVGICSNCHSWIHDHSNIAYAAGWLTPTYKGYAPNPSHPQPFTLLPYP